MGGGCHVGPKAWQEGNVNELTDLQRYDPISGFPVYKALLCDVAKDEDGGKTVTIGTGERQTSSEMAKILEMKMPAVDRVYLDHNATTYIEPEVADAMAGYIHDRFGNPSSIYKEGKTAKLALDSARRSLAQLLNCTAKRIVFTGCCTEANNYVIKGLAFANWNNGKKQIITTPIEHSSVLEPCRWLERFGYEVTYLPVDRTGRVDPEDLKAAIRSDTLLVSVMTANNETGSIQPIRELARIAKDRGVLFHTDATQAIGKIPIDVQELDADFLSLSGHKIYGPKGVGALYMREDGLLDQLIHGGEQERGLRAGTENLIGIVGLGKAAELAGQHLSCMEEIRRLRDRLEQGIMDIVPEARLNGHPAKRLPNTINMMLPGLRGESVVLALDQKGVSISSGSACHSSSSAPSHVLLAMGLSEEEVHCSVRISLGVRNTEGEIDRTLSLLSEMIHDQKATVRFTVCR